VGKSLTSERDDVLSIGTYRFRFRGLCCLPRVQCVFDGEDDPAARYWVLHLENYLLEFESTEPQGLIHEHKGYEAINKNTIKAAMWNPGTSKFSLPKFIRLLELIGHSPPFFGLSHRFYHKIPIKL
jgi:hypothetical protein